MWKQNITRLSPVDLYGYGPCSFKSGSCNNQSSHFRFPSDTVLKSFCPSFQRLSAYTYIIALEPVRGFSLILVILLKLSSSCSFYLDQSDFIDCYMKSEPYGPFQSLSEKTCRTGKAQIIRWSCHCLHHEGIMRGEGITPLIVYLGTRLGVISFISWSLHAQG